MDSSFVRIDDVISFKKEVHFSDFLAEDQSDFILSDFFNIVRKSVTVNTMENFYGNLSKFSGIETECGSTFLRKFKNTCLLKDIVDDEKILALFDIHLNGPASVWFLSLPNDVKNSWTAVQRVFRGKYDRDLDAGEAQSWNAIFNSLVLQDSLELYASKVQMYGNKLDKRDSDMQAAFISGLPDKLAFFVRARNPTDFESALIAAKMGDSFGYRGADSTIVQAAVSPSYSSPITTTPSTGRDQLSSLHSSIEQLTDAVHRLEVNQARQLPSHQHQQYAPRPRFASDPSRPQQYYRQSRQQYQPRQYHPRQHRPPIRCYRCHQLGHRERDCELKQGN